MSYRYSLKIAYDGTHFLGWQVQPKQRTVQGELERLLAEMMAVDSIRLEASGRTDTGVHARAQIAHVDLPKRVDPVYFRRGLNAQLSGDIRVIRVKRVSDSFHARFDAKEKEYRYFIYNGLIVPPQLRYYRLKEGRCLDAVRMQRAADQLIGTHDFASFASKRYLGDEDTIRTLTHLNVTRRGAEVMVQARANGFLYKMVRSLTGFLIEVGIGRCDPEDTQTILEKQQRTARVRTAKPQGLFLWNVSY